MGLYLPWSAIAGFTLATQSELRAYIDSQFTEARTAGVKPTAADAPADLTVAQAQKFCERLSDKLRLALRVIANSDPAGFRNTQVAATLGVDLAKSDLRGVWGGITKRTQTVLGPDSEALIWWAWDDASEDWIGRISPMTRRSLRAALNLPME